MSDERAAAERLLEDAHLIPDLRGSNGTRLRAEKVARAYLALAAHCERLTVALKDLRDIAALMPEPTLGEWNWPYLVEKADAALRADTAGG